MDRAELPPIDVYKIGESYFVSDGNHRVSIARQQGVETISAMVVEVKTRAPLPADAQLDDLILGAEYADFLERFLILGEHFFCLCVEVSLFCFFVEFFGCCFYFRDHALYFVHLL